MQAAEHIADAFYFIIRQRFAVVFRVAIGKLGKFTLAYHSIKLKWAANLSRNGNAMCAQMTSEFESIGVGGTWSIVPLQRFENTQNSFVITNRNAIGLLRATLCAQGLDMDITRFCLKNVLHGGVAGFFGTGLQALQQGCLVRTYRCQIIVSDDRWSWDLNHALILSAKRDRMMTARY